MVKKIKKKLSQEAGKTGWLVGFDTDGQAAMYVHRHGASDDHALCGPIVMCCDKCKPPYQLFAPDQMARVKTWMAQPASHLRGWFQGGLQTMYFVLCEPSDPEVFYFIEMGHAKALDLLYGKTPASEFRTEEHRIHVPTIKAQLAEMGKAAGGESPAAPGAGLAQAVVAEEAALAAAADAAPEAAPTPEA